MLAQAELPTTALPLASHLIIHLTIHLIHFISLKGKLLCGAGLKVIVSTKTRRYKL